jgi:hypothetical protein
MEIVKDVSQNLDFRCGHCPYFSPIKNPQAKEKQGECRYNPPVNFLVPVNTLQGQTVGMQSVFPVIIETGWCGKHPRRVFKAYPVEPEQVN